ncbi:hypothetical protein CEXT_174191 [Caerostris extrusa]|uniref:Uncharacterized protein n=1 Tax=Caerostris extrusa TaxID=172846 RepID=A0AAV4R7W2_CAEEX|nr:hypothetical protein CEXT_174191 [Caerostris extrusa]
MSQYHINLSDSGVSDNVGTGRRRTPPPDTVPPLPDGGLGGGDQQDVRRLREELLSEMRHFRPGRRKEICVGVQHVLQPEEAAECRHGNQPTAGC